MADYIPTDWKDRLVQFPSRYAVVYTGGSGKNLAPGFRAWTAVNPSAITVDSDNQVTMRGTGSSVQFYVDIPVMEGMSYVFSANMVQNGIATVTEAYADMEWRTSAGVAISNTANKSNANGQVTGNAVAPVGAEIVRLRLVINSVITSGSMVVTSFQFEQGVNPTAYEPPRYAHMIKAQGTITEPGTPVNAANMDHIEAGIVDAQDPAKILTALKTVDGSGSGLDADLLDGVQLSQLYQRTSDGRVLLLSAGTDLNAINASGFFNGTQLLNTPEGPGQSAFWYYVENFIHSNNPDYVFQKVMKLNLTLEPDVYFRVKSSGTWGQWRMLYHTGRKPQIEEWSYPPGARFIQGDWEAQSTSWKLMESFGLGMVPTYTTSGTNPTTTRRKTYSGTFSSTFNFEDTVASNTHYIEIRMQIGQGAEVVIGSAQAQGGQSPITCTSSQQNIDTTDGVTIRVYTRTTDVSTSKEHRVSLNNDATIRQFFVVSN